MIFIKKNSEVKRGGDENPLSVGFNPVKIL